MYEIRLRVAAEQDLADAASWYERQQPGLGYRFLNELEVVLAAIAERPRMYPVLHRKTRRALLRRFPFGVFFRIEADAVVVFGVLHASRAPAHWMTRTPEP